MADFTLVTEQNLQSEVLASSQPVILEFGGQFCKPCKTLEPLLVQLGEEWKGRVRLAKVEVEEHADLAQHYQVFSVPTIILVKGGVETARLVGLQPLVKLRSTFLPFI
jgi:thioredoxin 1